MATNMPSNTWNDMMEGLHLLPVPWDRQAQPNKESTPFSFWIKSVDSLIPQGTQCQLRVSLYDMTYSVFFGGTWTGPLLPTKPSGQKTRLNYNQNVYFHTGLSDPSIIMVVEIIADSKTPDGKTQQASCGWGFFKLFAFEGEMPDSGSGGTPPTQKMDIYHGSPRSLQFLDEPLEENKSLTLVNGCQLLFSVRTHSLMAHVKHLVPENVMVGANDVIPGLVKVPKDPKQPMISFLSKPKQCRGVSAFIDKIQITLGASLDKFEEELCRCLNEDRINRENKVADGTMIEVLERKLRIGVHNGWTYVAEPDVVNLALLEPSGGASLKRSARRGSVFHPPRGGAAALSSALTHKNRVQLEGLLDDPDFAVVFVIEMVLGEPLAAKRDKSVMQSSTFSVACRWTHWTPHAAQSPSEQKVELKGGPGSNPDAIFTFRGQTLESVGSMASLTNLPLGTMTFTFNKEQSESALAPSRALNTSHVSIQSESSSVLHPSEHLLAKPPIPPPQSPGVYPGYGQMLSPGGWPGPTGPASDNQAITGQSATLPVAMQQPMQQQPFMPPMPGYAPPGYYPFFQSMPPMFPTFLPDGGSPQATARGMATAGEMLEQSFVPSRSPIMAATPGAHSGQGLSRAAYAKLHSAGFPMVLDNNGDAPEALDPADLVTVAMEKEQGDALKANEVVLQFLAYSRFLHEPGGGAGIPAPKTVFFTFQFYRYPPITSERLFLGQVEGELSADPNSLPCILQKIEKDGSVSKGPPGYQVKYFMEPGVDLAPEEQVYFLNYLQHGTLHLDVWDGDSLMLIGSTRVELKRLCRQGRPATQVTYELDIISSDSAKESEGDVIRSTPTVQDDVTNKVRGRLHLRLANVGHRPEASADGKNVAISRQKTVVSGTVTGNSHFMGGSVSNPQAASISGKTVAKAKPMTETNLELNSMLFSQKNKDKEGVTNAAKQRKLARMEALREKGAVKEHQTLYGFKQEKENRSRDMKTIDRYRALQKREGIMNMLGVAISTEHAIYPCMGQAEFFEFVLKNPLNRETTVSIQYDDPELQVIMDPREWRHFKMLYDIYTQVEEGMFNRETRSGFPEIFLRPKESVTIPFKFLTFRADHTVHGQSPTDPYNMKRPPVDQSDNASNTRCIKVLFNTPEGKPVSILSLRVQPQPTITHQTFRFKNPEQSFLKKTLSMPPLNQIPGVPVGGPGLSQLFVRCSDPNVICACSTAGTNEPHQISVKVACGASPQVKRFYVAVYKDPFFSRPLQVWQFYVHALQRVDVSAIEGQSSRFTLILRGTQSTRLVQCHSSNPAEMAVKPTEPFMLTANSIQELNVSVRPSVSGTKHLFINVVDVEFHQLLRTWLVSVNSQKPTISKAFELQLPAAGGKGANKRISYTNPYPQRKVFNLRCSRSDLLQFKETRLELGAGETTNIGLRFAPTHTSGAVEVLVFINDEEDKNEETFAIRASYQ